MRIGSSGTPVPCRPWRLMQIFEPRLISNLGSGLMGLTFFGIHLKRQLGPPENNIDYPQEIEVPEN